MNKDEALHKALKVLNCLNNNRVYETAWVKGAINACEEALKQPAQEPVAWISESTLKHSAEYRNRFDDAKSWAEIRAVDRKTTNCDVPLYTHPHQWQGLTDDEIVKAFNLCDWMNEPITDFARAIEQALRSKNS